MDPVYITVGGTVLVALVTAGPAYLAARKSGKTAQAEGESTREALSVLAARMDADARIRDRDRAETREDLACLREDVQAVREWQAGHDAEHIALRGK